MHLCSAPTYRRLPPLGTSDSKLNNSSAWHPGAGDRDLTHGMPLIPPSDLSCTLNTSKAEKSQTFREICKTFKSHLGLLGIISAALQHLGEIRSQEDRVKEGCHWSHLTQSGLSANRKHARLVSTAAKVCLVFTNILLPRVGKLSLSSASLNIPLNCLNY